MNILLMGPQGSGKGTQAAKICEEFGFFYFESGAYLRRMAEKFPLIAEAQAQGKLVPDKEFTSYLTAYLDEQNLYDDILFDGFPRTVDQYLFLKNWLSKKNVRLDLVLVINISDKEAIKRLEARRSDPVTGKTYNLVTDPPPKDIDIARLVQRNDDVPDAIRKRLLLYRTQTGLLINELRKDSEVKVIDGERSIESISQDLIKIIKSYGHKN